MSESVEQAAPDWQARANREAAAMLDEMGEPRFVTRDTLISMLAVAWLQGTIYGSHETLSRAELAFDGLRAAL